jgi:glutamate racemase
LVTEPRPVLVFDSGVGGLAYLESARRVLPTERFVYLADTAHFPYGVLSADRIREFVLATVGHAIEQFEPKAVLLACNTASVVALAALRTTFQLPFVGTVPAVKPAAERKPGGAFVVLATEGTVQGDYLRQLIQRFAGGCQVELVAAGGLVRFVETAGLSSADSAERTRVVRQALAAVDGADSVVLACTHFIHLEPEFREVLGEEVEIIDSRDGVVRQLRRVLQDGDLMGDGDYYGEHLLCVSRHAPDYALHASRFGLRYFGELGTGP